MLTLLIGVCGRRIAALTTRAAALAPCAATTAAARSAWRPGGATLAALSPVRRCGHVLNFHELVVVHRPIANRLAHRIDPSERDGEQPWRREALWHRRLEDVQLVYAHRDEQKRARAVCRIGELE